MKTYEVEIEWTIHDTRDPYKTCYMTGTSKFRTKANNKLDVMNQAIEFANDIPSWDFEKNNIDLEKYRVYPVCTYYYRTQLSKVIYIKTAKEEL